MKKILLTLIIIPFIFNSAFSQGKRINLYGAYVFDDEVTSSYDSYNYFNGKIKGGFQYGAGIEFMKGDEFGVELLWQAQSTTAPTHYNYGYNAERFTELNVDLNYALLGLTQHMQKPGSKVEGYGGIMLGCLFASVDNPNNGNSESAEKFAWGLRLGANVWASDRVAIKLQGQILSAVQGAGGSLYFGTGGAGAGVSTYSSMLQFSIGGGLAFNLEKK
jgi:hypothetical protein